ncbi:MAG: ABC transporter permease [Thiohalomonadaceae bacterium]
MTGHPVAFSLRMLRRALRAGELRVLLVALVVAVASVTSVGFFTDRVRRAMDHQAGEMLAADRVLESTRPLRREWIAAADAHGLTRAEAWSFRSVAVAGERLELSEVKAVDAGYPLRGALRIADVPFGPERVAATGPAPGRAWLEPRLLQALGLRVGDALMLGELQLTVDAVLAYEPDRGGEVFNIAPRLLMNLADVPATRLIQTGSLVNYRLLLAGPERNLAGFRDAVQPSLGPSERLMGVRDARPELNAALERAERYLGLAALVSVMLAGVAVAVAATRYAERELDGAAVMRCLGARQGFLTAVFMLQLLWLALAAALLGAALGYGAHAVIVRLFGGLLGDGLPPPSALPALFGLVTATVTLAGFALPPVLAMRRVPPLRVLRRDVVPLPPRAHVAYGAAIGALSLLMLWQSRDPLLAGTVLGGALLTLAVLALAAMALIAVLRGLRRTGGVAWRFGLAALTRRARATTAQVVAFGIGIMVLLVLTLVRTDLLEQWRARLPADAPNHFLVNVQPDQVQELRAFFKARGVAEPQLYPMVRGRLVAINEREVSAADYEETRAQRLVRREFNLSWSRELPPENTVVQGAWWTSTGGGEWSVEQGLAETLGIRLGDRLVFSVAGQRVAGRVTSLRTLEWDSFNVNFFVLGPPGVLEAHPASYITSFHLPSQAKPMLAELVRAFPNVTVIDVDALMTRVRDIMDRVSHAVEFVFAFTLAAGLAVLFAAVQSTREERLREAAVLRTLGARAAHIRGALWTEFLVLGALSGLLAAAAATALGFVLATVVFDFGYGFDAWVWLAGAAGGAQGGGAGGVAGTRAVLRQPPLWTLRRM